MGSTNKRTGEKGQRTPRSIKPYGEKGGVEGTAQCECGARFSNKRWYGGEGDKPAAGRQRLVCPACRRIADRNPAGIVMLSGNFLAARKAEIDNLITNTVDISSRKNPLGRIMETTRTKEGITITTTDVKLAQKIGREIFKAHGGDLRFQWNHEEDLVRVNWSRS